MKKILILLLIVALPILALYWISTMPKEIANNFNIEGCYFEDEVIR